MSRHPNLSQHGFTLLEVLITIVIIAGALLGTAGMQAYGLKLTQGSQFQSQAVFIAADLIDRVDANNDGAKLGSYVKDPVVIPGVAPLACSTSIPCTAADIAAFDLSLFGTNLGAQLPSASAKITRTDLSPPSPPAAAANSGPWVYTVEIKWKEPTFKPKGTTSAATETTEFTYTVSRTVYDRSTVL